MSSPSHDEMPAGGLFDRLRMSALTMLVVGCVGSLVLLFFAGRKSDEHMVMVLMAGWVVAPFALLMLAYRRSMQWSVIVRATLYWMIILVAMVSIFAYVADLTGPPHPQAARIFVAVPVISVAVTLLALAIAAAIARWQAHRSRAE